MIHEQRQDDEDAAVEVRRAGRLGRRVVMIPGRLDVRAVAYRRVGVSSIAGVSRPDPAVI